MSAFLKLARPAAPRCVHITSGNRTMLSLRLCNWNTNQHLCRLFNTSRVAYEKSRSGREYRPPGYRSEREFPTPQPQGWKVEEKPQHQPWPPEPPQENNNNQSTVVYVIIGACTIIFAYSWSLEAKVKSKKTQEAMDAWTNFTKNWTSSLRNWKEGRYYTVVTSAFMHSDPMHLLMNMYVLYGFGPAVAAAHGTAAFLRLYFGSAIAGGLLQNYVWEKQGKWNHVGVGASGAILGVFTSFACMMPTAQMSIFFVPMRMWQGVALMTVVSIAGVFNLWLPTLGHADHLGGIMYGALWTLGLRRFPGFNILRKK